MTTIASFPDCTYADSLHLIELSAGDNNYNRRPKIHILNPNAAFAFTGTAIFPEAVIKAIRAELEECVDKIRTKGFIGGSDGEIICDILGPDSTVLLILRDTRWVIGDKKVTFIPSNMDCVLGSGGPHQNSLRFLQPTETREMILSRLVLMDDFSRGPWVRLKHKVLAAL